MHFRHISAKIQPKILNLFIIIFYQCKATFRLGGSGLPGPTPGYALAANKELILDL